MRYPAQIYAIWHEGTGRVYVGVSCDPVKRYDQHVGALRHGKHPVELFQMDYNLFGKELTLVILETINSKQERRKEFKRQTRLRSLDPKHGYNYRDPFGSDPKHRQWGDRLRELLTQHT